MLDVGKTIPIQLTLTPTIELVRERGAARESNCSGARCWIPQSAYSLAAVVPLVSVALSNSNPLVLSANVRRDCSPGEIMYGPPHPLWISPNPKYPTES